MGNNSEGFTNETNIINYINNNKSSDYNDNIKRFLRFVFDLDLEDNNVIASKIGAQNKADIVLECNDKKKYISLKKGNGNSVHQEELITFADFLRDVSISYRTIDYLKIYHYGDRTTDGTGRVRYSAKEVQKLFANEVNTINYELNQPMNLESIVDRVLFSGKSKYNYPAEIIYYGTLDSGLWATKEEILDYFLSNSHESKGVNLGSLYYQVWGRDNKFSAKYPDRRHIMQIKWSSLEKDLRLIRMRSHGK